MTSTAASPGELDPTPGSTSSASSAETWVRRTSDRLVDSTRNTPGRIRLLSIGIAAVVALTALSTAASVSDRRAAASRTATTTEPLVLASQNAHASLVAADAAAAAAFLSGGTEDPAQIQAYDESLARASTELQTAASRSAGNAAAEDAVRQASEQIPVYAGLVERARSNNRLGFPIGAAYLRAASDLVHEETIPSIERLSVIGNEALVDEYDGVRRTDLASGLGLTLFFGAVIGLLITLQRFVASRTRRTLNPPLAGATVVAVLAGLFVAASFLSFASRFTAAKADGYDLVASASRVRTTAFDARADESLALIARGNGARFVAEFDEGASTMNEFLLRVVEASSNEEERAAAARVDGLWRTYLVHNATVRSHVAAGDQQAAVAEALGPGAAAFTAFDDAVADMISANQAEFDDRIDRADRAIARVGWLVALAAAAVVALLALGVAPRLAEYR